MPIWKSRNCASAFDLRPFSSVRMLPAIPAAQSSKNTAMPTASSISLKPGSWLAIRFKPLNMAKRKMSEKPSEVEAFFTQSGVRPKFSSLPLP